MSNIQERLSSLEQRLKTEQRRLKRSLIFTTVVYGVLVVVAAIYAFVIAGSLEAQTSRKALAEVLRGQVSRIPEVRQQLVLDYRNNRERWAKETVDGAKEMLPLVERRVEEVLEQGTDILADEIRTKLVPEMANALAAHAKEIRAEHRRLTDPEVSEGVVVAFMGVVDTELDRYVNEQLIATIDRLRDRLARLARLDAKLTRREDAQRRFLQHWWILNHRAPVGESVLNRPFGVSVEEWPILYFLGEELKKGIKK